MPMPAMPALRTARLLLRPFVMEDLGAIHQLLDLELKDEDSGAEKMAGLEERGEWLQWSVLNGAQLAQLNQPPYGDRAMVLQAGGELIGACGFVPCLAPFEQIPGFNAGRPAAARAKYTTEFGLYYAVSPRQQGQGYATEAARALLEYAFSQLQLKRLVATTRDDNPASIAVMRKLGMRLERNPRPDPPWLQVVGVIENRLP